MLMFMLIFMFYVYVILFYVIAEDEEASGEVTNCAHESDQERGWTEEI